MTHAQSHGWFKLPTVFREPSVGILLCIVLGAAVHSRVYANSLAEDAYVIYRQALNLAQGNGLTCNIGEHAEGTTAPLFSLALSLPVAFHLDPYRAAACVGTLAFMSCVATAYLTVRFSLRDAASKWLGLWAAALVAASPTLALQSQTGTQQMPYAAGIAIALCLYARRVSEGTRSTAWAWTMGLCSLVRPDAIIVFGVLLALLQVWQPTPKERLRLVTLDCLAFAAVLLPWMAFRWIYFGHWGTGDVAAIQVVPRQGSGALANVVGPLLHATVAWLIPFIRTHLVFTLLFCGCFLLASLRKVGIIALATLSAYGILAAAHSGASATPTVATMAPAIVPCIVAVTLGIRGYLFHQEQRVHNSHLPSYAIVGLAAIWSLYSIFDEPQPSTAAHINVNKWRQLGERFAPTLRSDDWAVSAVSIALPYYWRISMKDASGLCRHACNLAGGARSSEDGRCDRDSLVRMKPTFFVFPDLESAAQLYRGAAFAPDRDQYYYVQLPYSFLEALKPPPPTVFVRKDRPAVNQLAETLGARLTDPGTELRRLGFDI